MKNSILVKYILLILIVIFLVFLAFKTNPLYNSSLDRIINKLVSGDTLIPSDISEYPVDQSNTDLVNEIVKEETPKIEVKKTVPVAPKEKTSSVVAPTLQNNTALPLSNPVPVYVHVTIPAPIVIVQPSQTTEQPKQMPSTETTYTIKKGEDVTKSGAMIAEVRDFVSSLNDYVSWRKKAATATVEELQEMLIPNGYTLTTEN